MPFQDWNLRSTFDGSYQIGVGIKRPDWLAEPRLNYNRAVLYPKAERLAQVYRDAVSPPIGATDTVVIVGGGFGWSAEALELLTGCDAIGIDTSSWVHSVKDSPEDADYTAAFDAAGVPAGERAALVADLRARGRGAGNRARVPISNESMSNNGSRNRVKGLFASGRVTIGISEDMLSTLTDAEITSALSNLGALDSFRAAIHLVSTSEIADTGQPGNWKTLAGWRTFLNGLGLSSHILIETGTYRVL